MPKLTDKLVRGAVESFDKEFNESYFHCGDIRSCRCETTEPANIAVKSFLETKIRQAVEEVKERLTLKEEQLAEYAGDAMFKVGFVSGYERAVEDLEELKKSI